jgi:hypothetical protein
MWRPHRAKGKENRALVQGTGQKSQNVTEGMLVSGWESEDDRSVIDVEACCATWHWQRWLSLQLRINLAAGPQLTAPSPVTAQSHLASS